MPDEKGLADLIWRSYRLKMIVLLASLACILLVASALRNGRRAVAEINKRSVDARLKWAAKLVAIAPGSVVLTSQPQYSDPSQAEFIDELELRFYNMLIPVIPSNTDDPKAAAGLETLRARTNEIQRFMAERENAYNLEFGIANIKSSVFVNALTVIDFWPLLLLCILAGVSAITMRQRAYEIILSSMIQESKEARERAVQSASTGFLAGDLKPASLGEDRISVYTPPLILLPEPLITSCLLLAVLYFSIGLPETEMPTSLGLNSTVFGYHTLLIVLGGLLFVVLLKTRAYYDSIIRAATGTRVLGWISVGIAKWHRLVRSAVLKPIVDKIGVYLLGTIALISLFLPWIGNWHLSGFQIFLPQKPISQNGKLVFYKMDPSIIREMRVQLSIVVAFIILMLLGAMIRRSHKSMILIRKTSYYFALAVLTLTVNFLVYLILLGYNSQRSVLNAVFTMFLGPGASLESLETPRGIPLVMQYPMYGFYVFIFSLTCLCLWAVYRQPSERRLATLNPTQSTSS